MARISNQRGNVVLHHGRWTVLYWLRDAEKGWQRKRSTLKATTKPEAQAEASQFLIKINTDNQPGRLAHEPPTVGEFIEGQWAHYLTLRGHRPSTLRSYKATGNLYIIPVIGDKRIHQVVPADISQIMDRAGKKELGEKSLVNLYALLRVMFEVAQQNDLIPVSPVRSKIHRPVRRRKAKKPAKPTLSAEQAWKLLAEIPPGYRLLFLTDALTGLRVGELLALRWKNFDYENATLEVSDVIDGGSGKLIEGAKTEGSEATIKIARLLAGMLKDHRASTEWDQPDHFVFCWSDGRSFDQGYLRKKILYPALKRTGIEPGDGTHGFHLLRHSAATILHDLTGNPKLVQSLLRHTQAATTEGYIHVTEAVAEGASEALANAIIGENDRIN